MAAAQPDLFGEGPALPEGFRYQADLISPEEERTLLEAFHGLDFKEFEFQGFLGKRRVVSFGWRYDFNTREVQQAETMPAFLLPLRDKAAGLAVIPPADFQHALVTEYSAGAAIGWHRDKAVFGEVVGVSLLSACTFRLRRKAGVTWERASIIASPRSAYLLSGSARTEWEHSIPAVESLRYSVTFRSLRASAS
jgi:alkylated DNA repair dioxygenase AlkB